VIALRDGIYRAREWGGELVAMARVEHDVRTMRFNDGKCDPLGRFWGWLAQRGQGHAPTPRSTASTRAPAPTSRPRSRRWPTSPPPPTASRSPPTPAPSTGPTPPRTWCARGTGMPKPIRPLARPRVPPVRGQARRLDPRTHPCATKAGPMARRSTQKGHYWVAMFEGAQLLRFAPSGDIVASVPVPVQCPTMPCFGGDDLKTLFRHQRSQGPACRGSRTAAGIGHGDLDARRYARAACQLLRGLTWGIQGAIPPTGYLAPRMSPGLRPPPLFRCARHPIGVLVTRSGCRSAAHQRRVQVRRASGAPRSEIKTPLFLSSEPRQAQAVLP
jgi:hypothetical protein